MPVFTIQVPDGRKIDIEAADQQTAINGARQWSTANPMRNVTPAAKTGVDRARSDLLADQARDTSDDGKGKPFIQSATFGLMDEASGAKAAVETGAKNFLRHVLGENTPYTAGDAYKAGRDLFREQEAQERQQTSGKGVLGEELLGGLIGSAGGGKLIGKFITKGPSIGSRLVRSGIVGAGYGGAYGAGSGEGQDRLANAGKGAAVGAGAGVVLPAAASGVAKAARPIIAPLVDRLAPILDMLTTGPSAMDAPVVAQQAAGARAAITSPELRAARAIKMAMDRDAASGAGLKTGVAPMHAGGENLTSLFEVAAKSPGPARQAIRTAVAQHRGSVPAEVESVLANSFGAHGDYLDTLDQITKARGDNARAGMEKLADHLVTLDEDSVSALRSDLAKGAMKDAAANGLTSTDPGVRASAADLNRLADGVLDKPSAQTMTVRQAQDISESLLSAADAAYKSGNGSRGKALKALGQAIRQNARTPERGGFSEYDDWLKQYGTDSDHRRALELGRDALKGAAPERVQRELDAMGGSAADFYRKGVGEALLDKVRSSGGDIRVMRDLLRDRNMAAKVQMAFPDDVSFARFLESADRRVQQADINNRIMGGSPTYPLQAARADLEAQGGDVADMAGDLLTGNVVGLGRKGIKAALKKIPRAASVIQDPQANAALGRAAASPDELTRLLNMLQQNRAIQALVAAQAGRLAAPVGGPAMPQG